MANGGSTPLPYTMIETPALDKLANNLQMEPRLHFFPFITREDRELMVLEALMETRRLLKNARIKALP